MPGEYWWGLAAGVSYMVLLWVLARGESSHRLGFVARLRRKAMVRWGRPTT